MAKTEIIEAEKLKGEMHVHPRGILTKVVKLPLGRFMTINSDAKKWAIECQKIPVETARQLPGKTLGELMYRIGLSEMEIRSILG